MKLSEKGFQKILVESNLCDSFEYSQEDFTDGIVLSIEEATNLLRMLANAKLQSTIVADVYAESFRASFCEKLVQRLKQAGAQE